jgi:hypothetical protein
MLQFPHFEQERLQKENEEKKKLEKIKEIEREK